MSVLMNDFVRQWTDVAGDVQRAVEAVGSSGWYILGSHVAELEGALAVRCGVEFAVGVASGLDALEIGLRTLDLPPGAEVLTTPLSAFATTLAIVRAGHVPVFCDVDEQGLLDLNVARVALADRPSIRAILPVHLYGFAMDLSALERLASEFGVAIMEDCAQSIGARSSGRSTGTVGACGALSFYPTKNLGAMGDGGALLTNDPTIAARARRLRDYGQAAKYHHVEIGFNSRLDELHAAILSGAALPRLEAWTRRRREVATAYGASIRNGALTVPVLPPEMEPCCHLFPVLAAGGRERFEQHLQDHGVQTGRHYPVLIPDQPAMRGCSYGVAGKLTRARQFAEMEVSLPIHPYLTPEEVAQVIEAVNSWQS